MSQEPPIQREQPSIDSSFTEEPEQAQIANVQQQASNATEGGQQSSGAEGGQQSLGAEGGPESNAYIAMLRGIIQFTESLLDAIPSVNTVLVELKQTESEMEQTYNPNNYNSNVYARIQLEISNLMRAFNLCVLKGNGYIEACGELPDCIVDQNIEKVYADLEKDHIDSLKQFIEDILKKLENCTLQYSRFQESLKEVYSKTLALMESESGIEVWEKFRLSRQAAKGLQFCSAAIGVGAGFLGLTGVISRESTKYIVGISAACFIGSYLAQFPIAYKERAAERRVKHHHEKQGILEKHRKKIDEEIDKLTELRKEIDQMKEKQYQTEEKAKQLEKQRLRQLQSHDKQKIKGQLNKIRDLTRDIQKYKASRHTQEISDNSTSPDTDQTYGFPYQVSMSEQTNSPQTHQPVSARDTGGLNSRMETGRAPPMRRSITEEPVEVADTPPDEESDSENYSKEKKIHEKD